MGGSISILFFMTHFQNELSQHPVIGFLFSVLFYTIGLCSNLLFIQMPVIVMQIFQLAAWTIAIVVGCITIYEWLKKHKILKGK